MLQKKPKGCRNHSNRRYVITAAMLLLATSQAFAGWRVVYDPWTTGQVGANTTAQKLIEDKHNDRLDTDRKSTRLNSSHTVISYAVFCLAEMVSSRSLCLFSMSFWAVVLAPTCPVVQGS